MGDLDWLAQRFEEHRSRLAAVAYRMLGSHSEADDAVQEAWLRLSRADSGAVHNLGGWLTTVVGRVCLDMLRSRAALREDMARRLSAAHSRAGAATGSRWSGCMGCAAAWASPLPDRGIYRVLQSLEDRLQG
jgi:RNA polymerase sigma factor (sigma-70 family)